MSSRDKNRIVIRPTSYEKEKFKELWENLQEQCNISPKRQSEIIIEGFFQYAENLLSTYIPPTHTKSQSLTKQRKEAIYSIADKIKEEGFLFYTQSYADLILSNTCFGEVKARTRSVYFQNLLTVEELWFLYIPYYFDTNTKSPIVIIHRQSKWFPQIKDLLFNLKEPVYNCTHDQTTDAKLRDIIFNELKKKAKYKGNIDRAERTMLNAFLYEIGQLAENPMYDNSDLVLREVIQLRSELRFEEANELLQQEKEKVISISSKEINNELNSVLGGLKK